MSPSRPPPTTALILCGGLSRRMGRPKAFVQVQGAALIERVAALARRLCEHVLLVSPRPEELAALGLAVVGDERPGLGPLEALRVGLDAAPTEEVYALACDLPALSIGPLRQMAALLGEADAVVPRSERGIEPLCALYRRRRCAWAFARTIEVGERAPHRALSALVVVHPTSVELGAPAGLFDNLNTPADLARWSD